MRVVLFTLPVSETGAIRGEQLGGFEDTRGREAIIGYDCTLKSTPALLEDR